MDGGSVLNRDMVLARLHDMEEAEAVLRAYANEAQAPHPDGAAAPPGPTDARAQASRSARYAFIVLVEAAATICSHICAHLLRVAPTAYADCFSRLAAAGILDRDLAERLMGMARLRNLVVHLYHQVDEERFAEILRTDLGDVERYVQVVHDILGEEVAGG